MANRARDNADEPADFETAIAECGFGLFNVFILCSAVPCLTAMVFSASALSYVMPSAECDLDLSIVDKGMLHAVTYAGMIISAVPWGFIADTIGRRPVLISGGWLDGFFVLCASLSQNTAQLMAFKFFDGLIICGPFAVVVSYLAEFHGKKHRPYIMLFVGLCVSIGSMILPLLSYVLLPVPILFTVSSMKFRTWQVFLAVSSAPSLLSGFLHIFLPESPKFLMSQGNYKKALDSLQRIYKLNKRKSKESYPIKHLTDPTPDRSDDIDGTGRPSTLQERFSRAKSKFIDGFKQLKPMFSSPYLAISLQVYCLHFCQIMCVNSVRLWLPQIFATMNAMDTLGANDTSMCAVLEHNANAKSMDEEEKRVECALVGRRSLVMGFQDLSWNWSGRFSDHFSLNEIPSGLESHTDLYFVKTSLVTMMVSAVYLTMMGICATTIIGMSVVIFPTLMRTMVLLLIMTFGRLGSVSGNMLLPVFMQLSCLAPFLWLCSLMSIAFLFSLFLKVDDEQSLN
ncbi:synaptic vesicle glycoprotein 2A isoform X4 [Drosophila sechellia]|uniref:GM26155 n=1 Tax=Drosophila sechellia TaxID=7238 RepID=B4HIR0_DROSE|nr:synaptic vesicle glycoprotein 2A isoform X4 [Drosophila sechellia]EDW42707.1 GM26155 [Drosophila sechellia]